jgi:hypothetical protein
MGYVYRHPNQRASPAKGHLSCVICIPVAQLPVLPLDGDIAAKSPSTITVSVIGAFLKMSHELVFAVNDKHLPQPQLDGVLNHQAHTHSDSSIH